MANTQILRQYLVKQGDTIELVAKLVFGKASRWREVVELNRLDYPYIDTSGVQIPETKTVAIIGSRLLIAFLPGEPIVDGIFADISRGQDAYEILFGNDIELTVNGDLAVEDGRGDLALIRGSGNLGQALHMKCVSHKGELVYHPEYGTTLHELIGEQLEIITASKIKVETQRVMYTDPRIDLVKSLSVKSKGDVALHVEAVVSAIGADREVPLNLIIPKRGL